MRKQKYAIWVVATLVIALVLSASLAGWLDPLISQASSVQNSPVAVLDESTNVITPAQAELSGVLPTQEVLSQLYDEVAPSVVNIQVAVQAQAQNLPQIPGLPFDEPAVPMPSQGQGSGFIIDNDGHIVTNNHVVEDATEITVYFDNGMWADATLVAADPQADLAVIHVDPPADFDWQPLSLAVDDSVRVGYYVVALGSPFGLNETMTVGVISALGRSFPTGDPMEGSNYSLPDVIQTDTAINPGNSGGPLLNLNGEVVGVNFAINSPVRSNSGVGFAIPVSVVGKVVPALIENGTYDYSYLGIAGQTITKPVAEAENLANNTLGVLVGTVVEGGPAEAAGVEAGDVIVAIDNQPVRRFEDLISHLFHSTEPGQGVTLQVLRNGREQMLTVTLAVRPGSDEEPQARENPREADEVAIGAAIRTAREAVLDAGLMEQIDSASAKKESRNGDSVWVVSLSGDGNSATVVVDARTGEVVSLDVE